MAINTITIIRFININQFRFIIIIKINNTTSVAMSQVSSNVQATSLLPVTVTITTAANIIKTLLDLRHRLLFHLLLLRPRPRLLLVRINNNNDKDKDKNNIKDNITIIIIILMLTNINKDRSTRRSPLQLPQRWS